MQSCIHMELRDLLTPDDTSRVHNIESLNIFVIQKKKSTLQTNLGEQDDEKSNSY